ncbi:MAG: hypothetical protein QOH24_1687 [Verrucomicrobiota bacterium]|jgi:hypothetical protein
MSTEVKPNLQLEIGHVLFIDIVGYSKRLIDDQRELQQQLNEIVRNTEQFRSADAAGKLVRLPTGDGMALVSEAIRASRKLSPHSRQKNDVEALVPTA